VQTPGRPRLHCFVNGIYSHQIGGGDIYFSHVAKAAVDAGYELHFYGGHALKDFLAAQGLPLNVTLTDDRIADLGDVSALPGQVRLLRDFAGRCRRTLGQLQAIREEDLAYAMSDYWFDSIPLLRCRARAKVMYLGMMAPTLREVLLKQRADVTGSRLASLYYWASQQFSLRAFHRVRVKKFTYSHPAMRGYLLRFGYAESELALVANGMDVERADQTPEQPKEFDVAWTGRVHPQKGIDDLLATLECLSKRVADFRALIIGKSKEGLEPKVRALGLTAHVTFSGLVSEEEKFRLLKRSRVFLMPSRYESWGIVVGEALACGVPVVAYELDCYRPVFGDFVRYVKPFDREEFVRAAEREVAEMRAGRNYLNGMDLAKLKRELRWTASQRAFREVLDGLAGFSPTTNGRE
jgi:glycosyltransferase involved in cell wall biosynthesis